MLFTLVFLVLATSTTIQSAPAASESEAAQLSTLEITVEINGEKWDKFLKNLVEKVYGPTNEPISSELLAKPIENEVYKEKVYPVLLELTQEGGSQQFVKEFNKQFFIQLGTDDMNEEYEVPPMPTDYSSEDFTITEEEKENALNHPQSINSITFAYRKAFVIARTHGVENIRNKVHEAIEDGIEIYQDVKDKIEDRIEETIDHYHGIYNDAKQRIEEKVAEGVEKVNQVKGKVQNMRDDWNSETPSEGIKSLKDQYTKAKDVYHQAKDALYNYWYPKSETN